MNKKKSSFEQSDEGRGFFRDLSHLLDKHEKEPQFDQLYKSVVSLLSSYNNNYISDVEYQISVQEKKLKFIYAIFALINQLHVESDEVLHNIVDMIPGVFHYPEKTFARILVGELQFFTKDFRDSSQKLTADILVDNEVEGSIEVVFTGEGSSSGEALFLPEEYQLIDVLAKSVGQFLLRIKTRTEYERSMIRLNKAQELARMGDFVWELSSGKVTWSDGMYKLLEYDKQEQINIDKVNVDIHYQDDLDMVVEWLNACIQSGQGEYGPKEYRLVTKSGKILDVETTLNVLHENDKPVRIFGTVHDITARKKNQAGRKKAEEIKDAIINSSPLAILSIDLKGHVMTWNNAAVKIFGWTFNEVKGKRLPIVQDERIER